jgi:AcrR family transcriptional regulator
VTVGLPDHLDEPRSVRKRQAILDAATEAFLRNGYLGTSMDEIAANAQVSKQTVYKHFADKERLFHAIVTSAVAEVADPNDADVHALQDSGDLARDLRALALRQLKRVLQPEILRLRRLVIAEASRFPELGRAFYEQGPGRTVEALTEAFRGLAERGLLRLEDPRVAAAHFNWLVMSIPLNDAMLLGNDTTPPTAALKRYADSGVRVFLAAYAG